MNELKEYLKKEKLKKEIVNIIDDLLLNNPTMSTKPVIEMFEELIILYK